MLTMRTVWLTGASARAVGLFQVVCGWCEISVSAVSFVLFADEYSRLVSLYILCFFFALPLEDEAEIRLYSAGRSDTVNYKSDTGCGLNRK